MFVWIVAADPPGRGEFLEEDRRADPDRDRERGHQPEQPEAPAIPTRNPASAGSLDCLFVARAQRNVPESRDVIADGVPGACRLPAEHRADDRPQQHRQHDHPVRVARKQATPKTGPQEPVRMRRCGR